MSGAVWRCWIATMTTVRISLPPAARAPSRLFVNASTPGGAITFTKADLPDLSDVTGAYPLDVDSDGVP